MELVSRIHMLAEHYRLSRCVGEGADGGRTSWLMLPAWEAARAPPSSDDEQDCDDDRWIELLRKPNVHRERASSFESCSRQVKFGSASDFSEQGQHAMFPYGEMGGLALRA